MIFRYTAPASVALALALHLAGCERQAAAPVERTDGPAIQASTILTPSPVAATVATAAMAPADRDPQAVLAWWKAAMERRDWAAARSVWGDFGERSGSSPQDFARIWGRYSAIAIDLGPGRQDGGAGSLYYEVPVTIRGTLAGRAAPARTGTLVLRRVNDVDGATAEQLRWHVERLDLSE